MRIFTRHGLLSILIIVSAMLVSLVLAGTTGQAKNMRLAQRHADKIQGILADERFLLVKIGMYTGRHGCLWVIGQVENRDDLEALRDLVEKTNPPVPIQYDVTVYKEKEPEWFTETHPFRS